MKITLHIGGVDNLLVRLEPENDTEKSIMDIATTLHGENMLKCLRTGEAYLIDTKFKSK